MMIHVTYYVKRRYSLIVYQKGFKSIMNMLIFIFLYDIIIFWNNDIVSTRDRAQDFKQESNREYEI